MATAKATTEQAKRELWKPFVNHCIGCGVVLNKTNQDLSIPFDYSLHDIHCYSCGLAEDRRDHSHPKEWSLFAPVGYSKNNSGLNSKVYFFCNGCGVKMTVLGEDKCEVCKEALKQHLS